jgi:hypothetical protein
MQRHDLLPALAVPEYNERQALARGLQPSFQIRRTV